MADVTGINQVWVYDDYHRRCPGPNTPQAHFPRLTKRLHVGVLALSQPYVSEIQKVLEATPKANED